MPAMPETVVAINLTVAGLHHKAIDPVQTLTFISDFGMLVCAGLYRDASGVLESGSFPACAEAPAQHN